MRDNFELYLTIPGPPVGKARPRAGKFGVFYTPKKTKNYESLVKMIASNEMDEDPLECPVFIVIKSFFPIPQSWSNKKKSLAESGDLLPCVKPDLDNVEKSILDGLQGIVFKDDKQVVEVLKRKSYSTRPRVEVLIRDFSTVVF